LALGISDLGALIAQLCRTNTRAGWRPPQQQNHGVAISSLSDHHRRCL